MTHERSLLTTLFAMTVAPVVVIGAGVVAGAPLTPPAAAPTTQAGGPFTMPSAETRPSRQAFSSWESSALFRLEAMRCAAAEAPLQDDLKEHLVDLIATARSDVNRVGTRYLAGELRSADARKSVEAVMRQLKLDLAKTLGDRSAAFDARVDKTMGDAQLFTDPAGGELVIEAAVKPTEIQKARITAMLNDAARELEKTATTDPAEMLARRHALGFSTRASIRAILTPQQLQALDGPFETPAAIVATTPPATTQAADGPTTGEARSGLSEAQAIALTRLEALRYAVVEGPYPPEVKSALADRIAVGSDRVKESPTPAPKSGFAADDDRVGRVYASVLDDASKTLHDEAAGLIRRQGRIYQDVTDLSSSESWRGKATLESLSLSTSQRAQIDAILADSAERLRALDAKPAQSPLAFDAIPAPTTRPKQKYADFFASDPTLGPAARSLRRRKIAFETRAALRGVLTPQQQAAWDAGEGK